MEVYRLASREPYEFQYGVFTKEGKGNITKLLRLAFDDLCANAPISEGKYPENYNSMKGSLVSILKSHMAMIPYYALDDEDGLQFSNIIEQYRDECFDHITAACFTSVYLDDFQTLTQVY